MKLLLALAFLLFVSAQAFAEELGDNDELSYWPGWSEGDQNKVRDQTGAGEGDACAASTAPGSPHPSLRLCLHIVEGGRFFGLCRGSPDYPLWKKEGLGGERGSRALVLRRAQRGTDAETRGLFYPFMQANLTGAGEASEFGRQSGSVSRWMRGDGWAWICKAPSTCLALAKDWGDWSLSPGAYSPDSHPREVAEEDGGWRAGVSGGLIYSRLWRQDR